MLSEDLPVNLDPALTEDAVYEVTRKIKVLSGVATVTLKHDEPHFGLIVLHPGADRRLILDSVLEIPGVTGVEMERRAA